MAPSSSQLDHSSPGQSRSVGRTVRTVPPADGGELLDKVQSCGVDLEVHGVPGVRAGSNTSIAAGKDRQKSKAPADEASVCRQTTV
jgi:hypothetical protein